MLLISLFMILLVLIQRGRGGGLAGAFGGMGGQSAFGTRAGDTFTRITIVLAVVWVLLAGGLGMMMRAETEAAKTGKNSAFEDGTEAGKDKTKDDSGDLKLDDADDSKATEPVKGDSVAPGSETKSDADDTKTPEALKAEAEKSEAEKSESKAEEKSSAEENPATPAEPPADAPAANSDAKASEPEAAKEVPATEAKP